MKSVKNEHERPLFALHEFKIVSLRLLEKVSIIRTILVIKFTVDLLLILNIHVKYTSRMLIRSQDNIIRTCFKVDRPQLNIMQIKKN